MKKIVLILMLLTCFCGFAQKEVAKRVNALLNNSATFKHYSVLDISAGIQNADTDKAVDKATFAKINTAALTSLVNAKNENIEVAIPYLGTTIDVQLYKVDIFAEGFHVDSDVSKYIPYEKGVHYRGIVKGDPNSLVAMNFFKDEMSGIVSNTTCNNLVIAKLDKPGNLSDYIIYSDADLKVLNNFKCRAKDVATNTVDKPKNRAAAPQSTRCVAMYFEIDRNLYQQNGSSTTTTTNWMTSVFNNVQTLYTNDGISISLKSMFIWTTADPYNNIGTSSSDYLYKFHDVRPIFDGDVGQLVGIDPGGLGGVAVTIDGLCSQDNFSYSDVEFSYNTVPQYSWTIMVITHEFGHLLGSPHTHACVWNGDNTPIDNCGPDAIGSSGEGFECMANPPIIPQDQGTIMSYCHLQNVGINLANGFGPQPAALVLATVNAGSCLSSDCINTCTNTVFNVTVTSITNTTASVNWSDNSGLSSWEIAATPTTTTGTPAWTTVTAHPYAVSGLSPNTFYRIQIRKSCGFSLIAPNAEAVFVTPTDFCSNVVLTDTGGEFQDYRDSETYVRVLIPSLPNKKIGITFTHFDLELDYDYLHIYDGNSTTATDLSAGGYTGTTNPGTFVSTAADGSLTIKFDSDGGVVASGYMANVTCISTLANETFVPNIDFTYYPNPTNGQVNITSKTEIKEVFVYNPQGRLLYHEQINALNKKVDISAFSIGTYFFKLKFDGKEANFKILKKN